MAFEREVKQNFASRLGESVSNAAETMQQGIAFADKLKTAQSQRDALAERQKMMQEEFEQQKSQAKIQAFQTQMSIASQLSKYSDPKKRKLAAQQYAPILQESFGMVGMEYDPNSTIDLISQFAEEHDNFRVVLENSYSLMENASDPASLRKAVQNAQDALSQLPKFAQEGYATMLDELQQVAQTKEAEQVAAKKGLVPTKLTEKGGVEYGQPEKVEPSTYGLNKEQFIKAKTDFLDRVDKNPDIKAANKTVSQANNIIAFLKDNGNAIGDQAFVTLMARASGEVGNLAEQEQTRFEGSKALAEKIKQTYSTLAKGRLTDSNRKEAMDLLFRFMTGANKSYESKITELATQSGRATGVPANELINVAGLDIRSQISEETQKIIADEIQALEPKKAAGPANKGQAVNELNSLLKGRSPQELVDPQEKAKYNELLNQLRNFK